MARFVRRYSGRLLGFTLIELLVVIAIIAILAAILFPVFISSKERAQATKCVGNIKQLLSALQLYTSDNDGRLPGSPNSFVEYKPAVMPYVKNDAVFYCPNDKTKKTSITGQIRWPASYAMNPRLAYQPIDTPVCSNSPIVGNGCGKTLRPSNRAYMHYMIVELLPAHSWEENPTVFNHYGGRPQGYRDGSIRWVNDQSRDVSKDHDY